MTVSSSTAKAGPYAGAGLPGPFTVPFRFLAASHLQVIKTSTAGIDAVLTLTTDYTVAGVGAASGSVTLTAPLAAGERLTIIRNAPFTQLADYVNNDAFPAESHEDALDLLTMQTQQLKERSDAALTLPATVTGVDTDLPTPESNKLIGWNQAANALQNFDATTLATIVAFGTSRADVFTGNNVQTQFALTANPGALANLDVAIGGVTQTPGVDYTFSGTTLTFISGAPALGAVILARFFQALPQGVTDSAASTFVQAGAGAVSRTVQDKLRATVSVKDFGAVGDGVADDTAAFNLATRAAAAYGDNVQIEIDLGGGYYRILGTVFMRKGQKLRGGGAHLFMSSTGSIKLGFNASNVEDPGGAPVWVEQVWFEGGLYPINALINGYYISNCFVSFSADGPVIGGTDAVVSSCIFDDGSTLLTLSGRNSTITNCNFYQGNNQINVGSGDHNVISGCVFHYARESSIKWDDGTHRSLRIADCSFMLNAQNAGTFRGFVYTGGGAAIVGDMTISSCTFRNGYSGAIRLDAATANYRIDIEDCAFDGNRTNSAYVQSTTMLAIDMTTGGSSRGVVTVTGCKFRNLHQTPIQIGGNESWTFTILDSVFTNNAGTRSIEVAGSNSSAVFTMGNIVGDGKNLLDFTSPGSLRVSGWLKRWLTETVSGPNAFVQVPFSGPVLLDTTLIACPAPGANANYRTVKSNLSAVSFDFTGGNFITQISNTSVFNSTSPLGYNLSLTAELNAVGGGTQVNSLNAPGYVVLSTLSSYGDRSWDVQYRHAENI